MSPGNTPARELHLNSNVLNSGKHDHGWRLQDDPLSYLDIRYYQHCAQVAERGTLDAVFLADGVAIGPEAGARPWNSLEPTVVLAAIAAVTERVGLVATASTTFNDPYNLARRFASLDQISGGRAAVNIVTSLDARSAANVSLEQPPGRGRALRAGGGVRRRPDQTVGQLGGRRAGRRPEVRCVRRYRAGSCHRPPWRPFLGRRAAERAQGAPGPPGYRAGRIVGDGQAASRPHRRRPVHGAEHFRGSAAVLLGDQGPGAPLRTRSRAGADSARAAADHRQHGGRGNGPAGGTRFVRRFRPRARTLRGTLRLPRWGT